jgi:peptidylprolyl isomerase
LAVIAAVALALLMTPPPPAPDIPAAPQQQTARAPQPGPATADNIVLLQLKDGVVEIEMLPNLAPNHVARIRELVRQKFYDGLKFHRVIEGFMVQTGDPRGNGTGGSGKNLNAEFSAEPHVRGIVSMARSQNPNSADSQFFIVTKDSRFLDRNYTVWGRVVSGMEFVDNIKKGDPNDNGAVVNPDAIVTMRMKSDAVAAR